MVSIAFISNQLEVFLVTSSFPKNVFWGRLSEPVEHLCLKRVIYHRQTLSKPPSSSQSQS